MNTSPIEIYEPSLARRKAMEPLVIADAMNRLAKVDISITTNGGGVMGQADAIRTAIARGLVKYNGGAEGDDEELRDEFLRFDRMPPRQRSSPQGAEASTRSRRSKKEAEVVPLR